MSRLATLARGEPSLLLLAFSLVHCTSVRQVMGKTAPQHLRRLLTEWSWTRASCSWILVGLSLCSFKIMASVTGTDTATSEASTAPATATTWMESTTTTSTVSRHELDYSGISGNPTVQLNFSASSSDPDSSGQQHIISVKSDITGRPFKILVVLENMVCDPRNGIRTYLWIKGADLEDEKQFCQNFQGGKLIISEGVGEVRIGTSQNWGDESAGTDNSATVRATAFYDPQANCLCRSLSSFCCAPCQKEPETHWNWKSARDFKTGYCIPVKLRCDFSLYCPCGAAEVPDVDQCDWLPDNDVAQVSMSIMLIYFVLGVCVMVGIIYLIPYFYRRRRRRAMEQAAVRTRAAPGRTNNGVQARAHASDCPPPTYESTTSVEYDYDNDNSMKHMHVPVFPDEYEPPPPSYDTIVVKN